MKVRTGFVSNSSSSSFVIGVKDDVLKKIQEGLETDLDRKIFDRIIEKKLDLNWFTYEYGEAFEGKKVSYDFSDLEGEAKEILLKHDYSKEEIEEIFEEDETYFEGEFVSLVASQVEDIIRKLDLPKEEYYIKNIDF